jgi:hypothetical protein
LFGQGHYEVAVVAFTEPDPEADEPEITSFDQDWKDVGSFCLVNDLRSITLDSGFAWIGPIWTNAALFLPSSSSVPLGKRFIEVAA